MFKVAVITRTKNRPILLWRALKSVQSQTHDNIVWVLINDGGETTEVEQIAASAIASGLETVVVHHSESKGMEAASNAGITASLSDLVVVHDDDDTWDPTFLSSCVSFLNFNPQYKGVVTQSMKIDEILHPDRVEIIGEEIFNPKLVSLYLVELAKENSYTTNSFVYYRSVLDVVGLYDTTLPVLGDWEFNLRVLSKFDIGVIPLPLANYHHRKSQKNGAGGYGNSQYTGPSKHSEFDVIIRNRLLRRDIETGKIGIGFFVNIGRLDQTSLVNHVIVRIGKAVKKTGLARWFWKL